MRAYEFLTERKKKRKKSKKSYGGYFYPGYGYYGSCDNNSGGDAGGESLREDAEKLNLQQEVEKFAEWAGKVLNIKELPKIELSMDSDEAQTNHHTGGHIPGSGHIWVYAKNRNLVDILRTVFHELVHVRQEEINMIKPGSSYPGSPIEAMADMLAGKYIKIYGEKNHHIFQ